MRRFLQAAASVCVLGLSLFLTVPTAFATEGASCTDGTPSGNGVCHIGGCGTVISGASGCDFGEQCCDPATISVSTAPSAPAAPTSPTLSCSDACSGGTLRDTCTTGEFQSFYCSESHQWCCASTAAAAASQSTSTTAPVKTGPLTFSIPQKCLQTGDCTLDDLATTGANFANFITGLSAALFFATFVYGGARYLLSFGDSKSVQKGKDAMTGAAYGMAIVLFAWTLLNYLVNAITGKL